MRHSAGLSQENCSVLFCLVFPTSALHLQWPLGQASSSSLEAPIRFVSVCGAAGIQRQVRCSIYPQECSAAMGEAIIKQVNTGICAAQPGRELSQTWRVEGLPKMVLWCWEVEDTLQRPLCGLTQEASPGSQKRHTCTLSRIILHGSRRSGSLRCVASLFPRVLISATRTFPKRFQPSLRKLVAQKGPWNLFGGWQMAFWKRNIMHSMKVKYIA